MTLVCVETELVNFLLTIYDYILGRGLFSSVILHVKWNEIWLELPAWIQLYNFVLGLLSAWIWNVTDSDHNIGRIRQPQREGGSSHSPWQSLREGFFHKKFLGTTHFLVRSIPWEKWGLKSCKNQNFKTPKNRARGNRKTLKRLKTMSKLNCRNLKLKSHEEYLICRPYFLWFSN